MASLQGGIHPLVVGLSGDEECNSVRNVEGLGANGIVEIRGR